MKNNQATIEKYYLINHNVSMRRMLIDIYRIIARAREALTRNDGQAVFGG